MAKDQPSPLSFAQERLWFLEQLEPGSSAYNICRAARLTGTLNREALEASLNEIMRRHEVLRTRFDVVDGRPVQKAAAEQKLSIRLIALQQLSSAERDAEVARLITEEARCPFNLSAGPLLRATLLRLSDNDRILVLTTHHIVSDAWSMGIFTRELWTLYETFANGRPSPMQDLPIQYADYAVWQREWLQGEVLETQLSYWRKQLENLPPLSLPTDHPRPAKQSFRGARQPISLPESLTAGINELSRREGVTQFMALLAAFQILLYRYTGQEDVVVGSPIANRNRTEVEELIGFFVNTLVLRTELSGRLTFKELLLRVRDVCLKAYAHQDLPFEKLVQELQPERNLSRNPLFQVMFALQNATRPLAEASGLSFERMEIETRTSQFDLALFLREREGKLIGFFEYNTDLFDRSTIERTADHFQTLLEGIVAEPDQSTSTLPLLTEEEKHQLLMEWNDTAADYPKDSCIHELFEAQVESTPEAIVVQFDGKQLTYRELNNRANQLGHYLRSLGIGAEKLVGICIERSIVMVVGLLGILKAGGAYVPLDPAYPRERLRFMLEDSQVLVLLTEERLIEDGRLNTEDRDPVSSILYSQMKLVCLDRDWETIAQQSMDNPGRGANPSNLAYIIYTSGSTGQPKGVAIEHRNTVALLYWAKSIFTNDELAGVLASTSICFDLSIFELFVPLSWGGKVILAVNALQFHSMPEDNEVTLVNTVPSVMNALMATGPLPESVRVVNLAGEPLPADLVNKIYEQGTVGKVYDLYGPSESTTYSTFTLRKQNGFATIGRPIFNTEIYILDAHWQPVPVGVPGEIFIGGAGLARGYLNHPELTAEKFIRNPFSDDRGARLYRTGDLARYRSDGNIEFLGRKDQQVKFRGYRIELGEIETALTKHPRVKDCVVVVRERESWTGKNLVGYVVQREHSVPSLSELRSYLKEKLPEYMIPSMFMILDTLPLTPNGKVDHQKLPPPDDAGAHVAQDFEVPRTEIERLIGQVWQDVLRIENIGIYDNFFELGGHSILAVHIVSRLQDAFNREIPLRVLFEAPTVAGLTGKLENVIRKGHGPELPPIVPIPRDQPLFLSMNQEHLWQLDQMIPGTHFFNMPYVYQLSGDLNINALQKALKEIVRRHEALRTVFAKIDGRPVQIIKDGSEFQLPVEDLRGGEPDDVSQRAAGLILEERELPFNLSIGALLRAKLVVLTDKQSLLLITIHHIISDEWSMQVFRRELAVLYKAFSQGDISPLPELSIQFADYVHWERSLLERGVLKKQLAYWAKRLGGPLPRLSFPPKQNREAEFSFRTLRVPLQFDETLVAGIRLLAVRENCTPFMVLVTALDIMLYRLTGEQDIRIGTLVANRGRSEIRDVVGHFLNTVILRTMISPDMTYRQLLKRVRGVTLAANANQELPFERLARAMQQETRIKSNPPFQVLLSYQVATMQDRELPGLTIAPFTWQAPNEDCGVMLTTYDLIFRLRETSTTLTGSVNYKTDTFDNNVVGDIIASLGALLKSMMLSLERQISETSLDFGT